VFPAVALAALILTACGQKSETPPAASGTEPVATNVAPDAAESSGVGTVSQPVPGFTYAFPQLNAADAALMEYLKQEQAKTLAAYAEFFNSPDMDGIDTSNYQSATEWVVASRVPGLVVLTADWMQFSGGAHEIYGNLALLWDEDALRPIGFADLFWDVDAAKEILGSLYCPALDDERLSRRGEPTPQDDPFGSCPDLFEEAQSHPSSVTDGKFRGVTVMLAPYVAGPFSEGTYTLEVSVPPEVIPLLKETYRPMFGN
jgi:hypothetical protein